MNKNKYLRWQIKKVKDALEYRRIVLLEGARQCGKTTLSKELPGDDVIFRTLDDLTLLTSATEDPSGFVKHGDELMIIDEIQRVPNLLLEIKKDVDINQNYGRYLLTGSANINSLPTVRDSLAGRISKVRLRPLAIGEIYGNQPNFIANAFNGIFNIIKGGYDKEKYIKYAMCGGYPEAVKINNTKASVKWHKDYLSALVDRDLKDIARINRKDKMIKLVEVLSAWSAKEMNIAQICSKLSITRETVDSYINALETLYLVDRIRPWHTTDYDRIKKRDKIFMSDTGLMSSILKWKIEDVKLNSDLNGKLIETFVCNQLCSILTAQEEDYEIYHYRDKDKREIDFLIQNENDNILGIEVKSGSAVNNDMFKYLKWFKKNLAKDNNFTGIVFYSGEEVLPFGENMWAVPINSLWA